MSIFRAFGLGVTILILQLLVPVIFSQLQNTIVAFLKAGEVSANVGSQIAGAASAIQFSGMNAEPSLPRVANITR
ncbi:MAG: hypothetical protein JWM39_408 [Parcubacteria group bacterium]|jgi:hypothetical protein|nr:hypothetical protein [Parcubacteria group bacterium]